jgi:hypothetical protein
MQVIIDMTQRDPTNRSSVQSYRYILEGRRSPSKMASYQQSMQNSAVNEDSSIAVNDPSNTSLLSPSKGDNAVSSKVHQTQISNLQALSPFPSYFSKICHPLFQKQHVRGVTPDDRIAIIAEVRDGRERSSM